METTDRSIQPLYDAGLLLDITPSDDPWIKEGAFAFQCRIAKPAKNPESSHSYYNDIPIEDTITNLDFPLRPNQWFHDITNHTNKWVFWAWEYMPGPGLTDFVSIFDSIDMAVAAVLRFYYGTSTIIGDWIVPLYRHPELSFDAVSHAISQALPIVPDKFATLEAARQEQARLANPQRGSWARASQSSFLQFFHYNEPSLKLYMRRDLLETYIVNT